MAHPHVWVHRRRLATLLAFNAGMMAWALYAMLTYKAGDGLGSFATVGAVWLAGGIALSLYVSFAPMRPSAPDPLRRVPPPVA